VPTRKKSKFVPIIEEAPPPSPAIHGRGASWSPANRFEKLHVDLGDGDVVQIDLSQVCLYSEEKPDGFPHWCSGAYPINKSLVNWIARYAVICGVLIAVEP
jgi:hypothetical protein